MLALGLVRRMPLEHLDQGLRGVGQGHAGSADRGCGGAHRVVFNLPADQAQQVARRLRLAQRLGRETGVADIAQAQQQFDAGQAVEPEIAFDAAVEPHIDVAVGVGLAHHRLDGAEQSRRDIGWKGGRERRLRVLRAGHRRLTGHPGNSSSASSRCSSSPQTRSTKRPCASSGSQSIQLYAALGMTKSRGASSARPVARR